MINHKQPSQSHPFPQLITKNLHSYISITERFVIDYTQNCPCLITNNIFIIKDTLSLLSITNMSVIDSVTFFTLPFGRNTFQTVCSKALWNRGLNKQHWVIRPRNKGMNKQQCSKAEQNKRLNKQHFSETLHNKGLI